MSCLNMASLTFSANGRARVSLEECYLFARQLHVLHKSGVPLLSSLHALQVQLPSGALGRLLRDVHRDLLEGKTFSQALGKHPRAFSPVFVSLVRVGEAGGMLSDVLAESAKLFEWELELRRRIQGALQYPAIVLMTLSVALTIMATFVLPRFAEMFQSFHITLPLQTRLLIALSRFLSHYGVLVLLALIGAGVAWGVYLRTEAGRLQWHTWKLKLPLLGPIFLQISMSRAARILSVLNRSGVPILETLELTGRSINNRYVRSRLDAVRSKVQAGEALAGAMKTERVFPAVVVQMVATGEETGKLDELLLSVSDYYDQQVDYTVKKLITYLEPLLLVVVGLGVLLMATAVFVPMWDLVKVFKTGR